MFADAVKIKKYPVMKEHITKNTGNTWFSAWGSGSSGIGRVDYSTGSSTFAPVVMKHILKLSLKGTVLSGFSR